jgi:hypothetical protein
MIDVAFWLVPCLYVTSMVVLFILLIIYYHKKEGDEKDENCYNYSLSEIKDPPFNYILDISGVICALMIFVSTLVTIIAMRIICKTVLQLNQINPQINIDKKIMTKHGIILVLLTLSVIVNSFPLSYISKSNIY